MSRIIRQVVFSAPVAPKLTKVSAYARVSSGKDAMLHSLSAQVSHYSQLIQNHPGWQYAGVYADEAVTGTRDTRAEFQRMIADCRAGKIDMVITKSISRFARNTITLLETVRELKKIGVDVYFEEQNIHTMSAEGELMITILASYAQEESRAVSENMKWRVRHNYENGLAWNGTILGYRYDKGTYIVKPDEAEIVRFIFNSYLDGMGLMAIAKALNEGDRVSRYGNEWCTSSIMRVLRNYTYTGNLLLQQTFSENHITKRRRQNNGELPMYHIQDSHEAIIPLERFNAVREEIKRRADEYFHPHTNKGNYLFTGRLVCGYCGKNYKRKSRPSGPVWICPTFCNKGKEYCSAQQIPESILEETVINAVGSLERFQAEVARARIESNNVICFELKDGATIRAQWRQRSRSESWTPEKKEAARQKSKECYRGNQWHTLEGKDERACVRT